VCADPLEDVHEIIVGIHALESASADEALDDPKILGTELGPAEQPVLSS